MRLPATLLSALFVSLALSAQLAHAMDAVEWLASANQAAKKLNYTGNYVYEHGENTEVLRVSHRVDGKNERQKIEVLDGPHREFIRINDDVYCHLADGKTVRIDKSAAQRFFPAVVPDAPSHLAQYYLLKLGGNEKIAGRDCQVIILEARDQFRHTHMIWVDRATSLPLKTQTVDSRGTLVSMYVFSELEVGRQPDKALFDVRMAGKRMQAAGFAASAQGDGWTLSPPPGYASILEAMRPLPGIKNPVLHKMYSDGISNLSIFIEPLAEGDTYMEGLSTEGATNIYARRVADHKIMAVGDVPAAALMEVVNSAQKK
jgi:sigma-E factor negative regulatory protein RseB